MRPRRKLVASLIALLLCGMPAALRAQAVNAPMRILVAIPPAAPSTRWRACWPSDSRTISARRWWSNAASVPAASSRPRH